MRRCDISMGGCSPRSAPRSWMGRLAPAPHRFAGRPRLLSLGAHQSPAGRPGKRESAARNGMGGVSNGDDFLSPWSELPPWADDLWRTTTGIVQVDAQARARPHTAQHVWVVLGREEPLACSWGGGRGGLGSRVASFIYRRRPPPTTGQGPLLLRATSGSTTSSLEPTRDSTPGQRQPSPPPTMSSSAPEEYAGESGYANSGGDSLTENLNIYYSVRFPLERGCRSGADPSRMATLLGS
jgi:hypothetical protein